MQDKTELDLAMEAEIEEYFKKTDFKNTFRTTTIGKTFNFNIDDIRDLNPKLSQYIIKQPNKAFKAFEERAKKIIEEMDSSIDAEKARLYQDKTFPTKLKNFRLNFTGNLGRNFVTPRGLNASMINSLVRVQGIVTRMTIVKPKLTKSYHYIPDTKQGYVQNYKDQYSIEGVGEYMSKMFPTKDINGNPMSAEYGYCNYTNVQKLVIQEMPERAPTGQIPRSVTIFIQDDLVDKVKPGDRIEVTGVFK